MKAIEFCYWLQGYFELDRVSAKPLTAKQVELIQRHLALVFKHDIDPQAGSPAYQQHMKLTFSAKMSENLKLVTPIEDRILNLEKVYSFEEINTLFNNSDISNDFKSVINRKINVLLQFMYNCAIEPEKTVKMTDTYGDIWQEEYNELVMEYQRYYN